MDPSVVRPIEIRTDAFAHASFRAIDNGDHQILVLTGNDAAFAALEEKIGEVRRILADEA